MLDFDPNRPPVPPRPAATILVLREGTTGPEVFFIARHPKSGFMGGVVAFPGGKVDEADAGPSWDDVVTALPTGMERFGELAAPARAIAIAACREALEEAAIVPTVGDRLDGAGAVALRARLSTGDAKTPLAELLRADGLTLDLARLVPFARWVTPTAETRRFDAVFFVLPAPTAQHGDHDRHETTSGFWDGPASLLAKWEAGQLMLAPPTVRCLELLAGCRDVAAALDVARAQSLLPIQPTLVMSDSGGFLALPGDPAHEIKEKRVDGGTRFVMKDGRFVSADP